MTFIVNLFTIRFMRLFSYILAFCLVCVEAMCSPASLSSWNEGVAKQAIVDFVRQTTDDKSPHFIPVEERIAVFDQDGTLWVEQPIYPQAKYCFDRLSVIVKDKPELALLEPFKKILAGHENITWEEFKALADVTLAGMSTDTFQEEVKSWIGSAKHPRWQRPYTDLAYVPMLEMLAYLREHSYKTYIVTGGGQDFVRVYAEKTYGIPPEQVVGTIGEVKYSYDTDGRPVLMKAPSLLLNDDFAGKPEGIHLMIGRRPRAAFGNSNGDQQMLEYTRGGPHLSLALLLLHDDAEREYAYGPAENLPNSSVGTFSQALYDKAKKEGWIIVSIKRDWKQVFSLFR